MSLMVYVAHQMGLLTEGPHHPVHAGPGAACVAPGLHPGPGAEIPQGVSEAL